MTTINNLPHDYQLDLMAYMGRKHTRQDIQVRKHSDYYEPLWNITVNGRSIGRGVTFEKAKKLLLPYIPDSLKTKETR